ncbi:MULTISPECIES: nuclear transport factor 2 family protein [unclassified Streptomyces]|uniref:nuclear transport factor 2 family protein n=1 Tax=unclassified Streptomyces TaxID=2593676 RepID=UPI00168AB553|nr:MULTISPECIES: nuclear transport factor 2 family protein [unclassified Streptomyces]MBD3005391.1 nuclear transport factor 2 family protein [Streptomyces sp. 5-10]
MQDNLEDRLRVIEDRLAIYNLLAAHPLSADTGEPGFIESIYTPDVVFDRGAGLAGARGRDNMVTFVGSDAHHTAIAGGLAHFGNLPLIELNGDTAMATSYIALITPDEKGEERELANHGTSTGFRIHRIVANRWSLVREDGRWSIASRKVLPMDGSGPALDMLRQTATYYTDR